MCVLTVHSSPYRTATLRERKNNSSIFLPRASPDRFPLDIHIHPMSEKRVYLVWRVIPCVPLAAHSAKGVFVSVHSVIADLDGTNCRARPLRVLLCLALCQRVNDSPKGAPYRPLSRDMTRAGVSAVPDAWPCVLVRQPDLRAWGFPTGRKRRGRNRGARLAWRRCCSPARTRFVQAARKQGPSEATSEACRSLHFSSHSAAHWE